MPIARTKKDSLVDSQISENIVTDIKLDSSQAKDNKNAQKSTNQKTGKNSFLGTTIEELRKVNWPTFEYVIRWSGIIILFTVVVALSLGFFDHLFTGGIKFVDCSSPTGQNQAVNTCGDRFVQYLTFRSS